MTSIDQADETFVVADVAVVAAWVARPEAPEEWFPDLRLVTTRDRGLKGRQWRVDGALVGTAEVWLEPWGDGVVVHWFLRADRAAGARGARRPESPRALTRSAQRESRQRVLRWKQVVHRLKDDLETGRRPGEPARPQAPARNAR